VKLQEHNPWKWWTRDCKGWDQSVV